MCYRKAVSLFVLCAVFINFLVPLSSAQEVIGSITQAQEVKGSVTQAQAIEIAAKLLNIPKYYRVGSAFIQEEPTGPCWQIYFEDPNINETAIQVGIDVSKGYITEYYRLPQSGNRLPVLSAGEAQKAAEDFMKRVLPQDFQRLLFPSENNVLNKNVEKDTAAAEFSFHFDRAENGYPVFGDGVEVSVDRATGVVSHYRMKWTPGIIPEAKEIISPQEAREIIHKNIGLELGYIPVSSDSGGKVVAYYPMTDLLDVDAVTGRIPILDSMQLIYREVYNANTITTSPQRVMDRRLDLDKEKALEVARTFAGLSTDYSIMSEEFSNPCWRFTWFSEKEPDNQVWVKVDTITGEIAGTNRVRSGITNSAAAGSLTVEEALNTALEFIKGALPSKLHQVSREPSRIQQGNFNGLTVYSFHFPRMINGLPFSWNGVDVSVSVKGEILEYDCNWETGPFSEPTVKIPAEKARKVFDEWNRFTLGYASLPLDDGDYKFYLVYRPAIPSDLYVDAGTGQVATRHEMNFPPDSFITDIDRHWAKNDIKKLARMNIIDRYQQAYRPNESITRADLVKMLVKTGNINRYYPGVPSFNDVPRNNPYYSYIEGAFREKIVFGDRGRFKPDDYLTREELAAILARAYRLKEDDKGLGEFRDAARISPWARSFVAALTRLRIFIGDGKGNFNPKGRVTRGEAAALMARLLERAESPADKSIGSSGTTRPVRTVL